MTLWPMASPYRLAQHELCLILHPLLSLYGGLYGGIRWAKVFGLAPDRLVQHLGDLDPGARRKVRFTELSQIATRRGFMDCESLSEACSWPLDLGQPCCNFCSSATPSCPPTSGCPSSPRSPSVRPSRRPAPRRRSRAGRAGDRELSLLLLLLLTNSRPPALWDAWLCVPGRALTGAWSRRRLRGAAVLHPRQRRQGGESHRAGSDLATWPSVLAGNPYHSPELGPRYGPTLCTSRSKVPEALPKPAARGGADARDDGTAADHAADG
jgi:hypothetical protein